MTLSTERRCCDDSATSSKAVYSTYGNRPISSSQTAVVLFGLSGILRRGRDATLESAGCEDNNEHDRPDQPDSCHCASDHKSLVRPAPVEVGPPDKVEHVLGFAREQDREKTEDNAGHRHEHGRKSEVPSERRQLRLALHDAAQTYMRGIKERIESMVPGGVCCCGFRRSNILLAGHGDQRSGGRLILLFVPVSSGSHTFIISTYGLE
jgi:hypothetical protein